MKWQTARLLDVAPPEPAKISPDSEASTWLLTLDQIESGTGSIVGKQIGKPSEAGSSTSPFDSGNVLYSKLRPYLNKVIWPQESGIATTELVPLRPKPCVLQCGYLTYYLRSQAFVTFAQSCVAGVKMPRIIMDKFWEHRIPLPPPSEQRRIVEILDQADAIRKKRDEANAKADRILQAIYYKMFGDPVTNPMNWPRVTLEEMAIDGPEYGANAKAAEWSPGRPRYVRITDIRADGTLSPDEVRTIDLDNWSAYELAWGDLLFARSGATVGKTYLYQPENGLCAFAGYLIRFRLNLDKVDPWYVFAYTQTAAYAAWVSTKKRVAAQPNINGQEYASLLMPSPPTRLQAIFGKTIRQWFTIKKRQDVVAKRIDLIFKTILHHAFSGNLTAKWREGHMKELLVELEQQAELLS